MCSTASEISGNRLARRAGSLFCASLVVLLAGCQQGPTLAEVTGTVTIRGQPAPLVVVQFAPVDGSRNSGGTTDPDGKYRVNFTAQRWGALLGEHHVLLRMMSDEATAQLNPAQRRSLKLEFDATVEPGENVIDFELLPRP